jgi:hypothetical protein
MMIAPPPVLPEEPAAVTPHGGICGGKSQQWLRYLSNLHAGFCLGGRVQEGHAGSVRTLARKGEPR